MVISIKKIGRYGYFVNPINKKLEIALFNNLSYKRQGWEFMTNKAWASIRFYSRKKRIFPWGLISQVENVLIQWCKLTQEKYLIENKSKLNFNNVQNNVQNFYFLLLG